MQLYHFTDKNIDVLKIDYFGKNSYTKNDKRYNIKRLFFYDSIEPKEYHLKSSKYRYTISINQNNIYDLDNDKNNLKITFNYNITDILHNIKNNFLGCSYTTSFKTYVIFENIKPIEKFIYINSEYK